MKRLPSTLLLILLLVVAVEAKPKSTNGKLLINSSDPVIISITNMNTGQIYDLAGLVSVLERELSPGIYRISFILPDRTERNRVVTIKARCTTSIELSYRPPSCPSCPVNVVPAKPTEERLQPKLEPEYVFKPGPTKFDECCACKSDDLKARLDLFAIELHRNPSVRGKVISGSTYAVDYLVNHRGVDRSRLDTVKSEGCTQLWTIP